MKNTLVAAGACLALFLGVAHFHATASSSFVDVSTVPELQAAVNNLTSGQVIRIAAGRYALTQTLRIRNGVTNVTLVGATGNRDDVVIVGSGMNTSGVDIAIKVENAQDVRIADLSVGEAFWHPIQLQGEQGAERVHVSNVRLFDAGQQFLKSTVDYGAALNGVDDVIVENSLIEFTVIGPPDGYTEGIDVHHGANWIIRNNVFRNFRVPPGASFVNRPCVLMWGGSSNTTVSGNTFINCERAIIFGQGGEVAGNSHSGGIIVNNFIYRTEPQHADAGISIWDSPGTRVYHNTVIQNGTYPAAIEYRFPSTTGVEIINNLTDGLILQRDNASALVTNNYTAATSSLFVNPAAGDLHLLPTAAVAIDQGQMVGVAVDLDADARPSGAAPDLGADERVSGSDTTPPTVSITQPGAGVVSGAVTMAATAQDDIGVVGVWFQVDGVNVSGEQPVAPFSTVWASTLVANGSHTLTALARDAAGHVTTSSPVAVTVSNAAQPVGSQTLVTTQVPGLPNYTDGFTYELGVRLRSDTAGQITAIRYWRAPSDAGTHVGRIWSAAGQLLASVPFTGETASGWQQQMLTTPLAIAANTEYVVTVPTGSGAHFVATLNAFPLTNGHLQGLQGRYGPVGSFPANATVDNYFRDVVFVPDGGGTNPPASQTLVTTQVPALSNYTDGNTYELGVRLRSDTAGQITAIRYWRAPSDAGTHVGRIWSAAGQLLASVPFTGETASGWQQQVLPTPLAIAANTEYVVSVPTGSGAHFVATLNVFPLTNGHLQGLQGRYGPVGSFPLNATVDNYFRDVVFVPDGGGTNPPASQTLVTTQMPALSNYTDGNTYELGVRLRSDTAGQITAIRYWRAPSDAGTHVGRIWSAAGQLLASVPFTGETASGWQQQTLPTPLAIAANTEYVVSVPTGAGAHFVATLNVFPLTNGHLQGLQGRYGPVGSFPLSATVDNYFRDVVFVANAGPPDTAPPTVAITQPAPGSTVSGVVTIAATASDDVGVAGVQFKIDGVDLGGEVTSAPYSAVWNSTTATNTSHTLTAVARDAAGRVTTSSPIVVTVSNGAQPASQTLVTTQAPALPNYTDGFTYELGVRLRSDTAGQITAIRYWRAPSDAGTHVGRIWSAAGQLLASVPFTGETASGWQQQALQTPLAIAANTEYVVSVPTGAGAHFVATLNVFPLTNGHLQGLQGRYGPVGSFPLSATVDNYFRDVVFVPDGGAIQTQLTQIVSGLSSPVFVGHAGDNSGRLFIVERGGAIKVLQPGATTPTVFLNITGRVQSGGEQGLLGLAFHPLYESNGRFFVFYTRSGGDLVVAEYHVSANPNLADSVEEILLTIPHGANTNHNGGMLAFGADNYLYIGVGDGGGANDGPNNAQNLNSLLGKILRIDINVPQGQTYVSPSSNPFAGAINGRDEIFAYGMRNPWRFGFDRLDGSLWVADVGQGAREEVNSPILGGGNYGWRIWEGFACTNNDAALCGSQAGYVFPTFDYAHTGGRCSITGGYVYRGSQGAVANGTYVYGDYCTGEIFGWTGGPAQPVLLDTALNISSFGEDESGELYVVGLGGTISKIVSMAPAPLPPPPPPPPDQLDGSVVRSLARLGAVVQVK